MQSRTNPNRPPLVLLNVVGLTQRVLPFVPSLADLAKRQWVRDLVEVQPAVTMTAQASLLTGAPPNEHGIVANGWLFRDTREVRFWQQSNSLLERTPFTSRLRALARARGGDFRAAKLFWWFNQGADVALSVTPKPHYGANGDKCFDVLVNTRSSHPVVTDALIRRALPPFPFPAFWGPMAGIASTSWISQLAALVLEREPWDLVMVYLPHLDYDPQRFGPSGVDWQRVGKELDDAVSPLLAAARALDADVWVVSEYGHVDVTRPIFINQTLRQSGWLSVRGGPFGEMLDTHESRAFAVVDHQLAHVYVRDREDTTAVAALLAEQTGIAATIVGPERAQLGLDHPRAGEIIALADRQAWFAYPYWLDPAMAPDFAPTIDIHRKPGFDPCEMFFDPRLRFPKLWAGYRLLQKKLGMRTYFDVVAQDASLVRGSHGLPAADPVDRPVFIASGPAPTTQLALPDVHRYVTERFDLEDSLAK